MGATDSSQYRYWAFISYSSQDKAWADWLHRAIEAYGIPSRLVNHETPVGEAAPKRFRPVFRDRAELSASADLAKEITEALRASRYLIVICSPAAARSQWVNKEIETFQDFGRADRILAVIVDGEPHAGGELECMPAALLAAEPIAADARKQGDGKDNARLKILAGMLGIGFDALKQREAHRRIRRLQAVVAAVSVLALAFAGIAWYAETQRVQAVKARQQAEGVLGYMLWDLREPLQDIGRLDILRGAQDLVDTYYRELGVDPNDPNMLRTREAAMLNNGVSLEEQGDLSGALAQYRAALAIGESLTARDPGNTQWLADLAVVHSRVGQAVEAQGDLGTALSEYAAALQIRTALVSAAPSVASRQREQADSLVAVGGVLQSQGDLAGALQQYQGALAISRSLLATFDATNVSWLGDVAVTESRIGDVLLTQGDLESALTEYTAGLEVARARVAAHPGNSLYQAALPTLHIGVGSIRQLQGDVSAALREFRSALTIAQRLTELDPANVDWQRGLVGALNHVGNALRRKGDISGAMAKYEAAAVICKRLAASDPTNMVLQRDLFFSHVNMGDVLFASRDFKRALAEDRSALQIAERLAALDPSNAAWRKDLAFIRETVDIVGQLESVMSK